MNSIECIDRIVSKTGEVHKYVFSISGQNVEFSYIDRGDGKQHVCCPSQTSCSQGCKFCFLTDYGAPVKNLSADEIVYCVRFILTRSAKLGAPTLLVSFMGSGEPLLNQIAVLTAMLAITDYYNAVPIYRTVRFAIATSVPSVAAMKSFTQKVYLGQLNVKLHWSFHIPDKDKRRMLMPGAVPSERVIPWLTNYRETTGNPVEAHYTLIDGVNDGERDIDSIVDLLKGTDIPVKFIEFNPKPSSLLRKASNGSLHAMLTELKWAGIKCESYCPPGADISSACGQFAAEHYVSKDDLRKVGA